MRTLEEYREFLDKKTVKELRGLGKELGIDLHWELRKDGIVNELSRHYKDPTDEEVVQDVVDADIESPEAELPQVLPPEPIKTLAEPAPIDQPLPAPSSGRFWTHVYGLLAVIGIALTIYSLIPPPPPPLPQEITVGGKHFIESSILLEMIAQVLEDEIGASAEIKRKHFIKETTYCKSDLLDGAIHLYPEYSGTLLAHLCKKPWPCFLIPQ